MKESDIKQAVRQGYAKVATQADSCCGPAGTCGSPNIAGTIALTVGYSEAEIRGVPEGANLGLGCGNPVALASLKEGETVLDLGSGAGLDCFLAANRVGPTGRVIGVDMTPEMVEKARANAAQGSYRNVEFRLGEIEYLPVADSSVDVVVSNCVINLSPDKRGVFQGAFRVLKPGGRLIVSDIVLLRDLPDSVRQSMEAYVGCVAGAAKKDAYLQAIHDAGFQGVTVLDETLYPAEGFVDPPPLFREIAHTVASVKVAAVKPA